MRLRKPGNVSELAKFRIRNKPIEDQSEFWIRKFSETDVAKEILRKNDRLKSVGKARSAGVSTEVIIHEASIERKQLYYDFVAGFLKFAEENKAPEEVMRILETQIRDVLRKVF